MTETRLPSEAGLSPRDSAAALLVVMLWGLNFVAVKLALHTLPPFLLTGLRFAVTAAILVPFFRPRRQQLGGILLLAAVLGFGHFGLIFFALSRMDAATAGIAIQLGIPFSALLAWLVFDEHLGWRRAVGMTVAFGGVALLAGEPHRPGILPLLAVVVSAMSWAWSNVVIKRIGAIDPLTLNGWVALFACPMLLGLSLAAETGQAEAIAATGWMGWSGLAYTIIGSTLIAYSLWYRLIERHPMNRVVPFTLLGPAVAVTGGVLLLGEPLTWHKLVGGILTVGGVGIIQLLPGRSITPIEEPEPGT
ncbi:Permease of the drug/metabolite transporter superfamily [Candidatus Terasakiella magnetica]|nr:Permease of the drug/metabolite transporter superfamily [Candidatus Terasakiella magnetica]